MGVQVCRTYSHSKRARMVCSRENDQGRYVSLNSIVDDALKNCYKRRIDIVGKVDIFKMLKQKNPYMYRAFGTNDAHDFVEDILLDAQSSSDETIFGDFFEEVAIGVSRNSKKSSGSGVDMEIWSDDLREVDLYAVKSGINVYNSSSRERQRQAFNEAIKRLKGYAVTPKVGYGYGRKKVVKSNKDNFQEEAGEVFWTQISSDPSFYLELIDLVGVSAEQHKINFDNEWQKCVNRQYKKFMDVFGLDNGSIDWKAIVRYSSAESMPKDIDKKIRASRKKEKEATINKTIEKTTKVVRKKVTKKRTKKSTK